MFCTLKNKTPKTNLLILFSFLGDFGKIPRTSMWLYTTKVCQPRHFRKASKTKVISMPDVNGMFSFLVGQLARHQAAMGFKWNRFECMLLEIEGVGDWLPLPDWSCTNLLQPGTCIGSVLKCHTLILSSTNVLSFKQWVGMMMNLKGQISVEVEIIRRNNVMPKQICAFSLLIVEIMLKSHHSWWSLKMWQVFLKDKGRQDFFHDLKNCLNFLSYSDEFPKRLWACVIPISQTTDEPNRTEERSTFCWKINKWRNK